MRYTIIEYQIFSPMRFFKKIHAFVSNGVTVFSAAAHGDYQNTSPNIELLNRELQESADGPAADRQKLRQDRKKIYKDVSDAFEEYVVMNKK